MDNKNLDNNFDIEGHFDYFLKKFFIIDGPMDPGTQKIMEKSFFAGMFHYYLIIKDIVLMTDKEKAANIFEDVFEQIKRKLNIKETIAPGQ